jgi:diguanylate cyclase (GGDEF)-like protein
MNILLVSDDPLFSRLASTRLAKWGHLVTTETTGTAALHRLKKETFRVVITGWDLEGTPGSELCSRIRETNRGRYTYVIVYSSRSRKEDVLAALEAGADDYLVRPFNPRELELHLRAAKRLLNLEDALREQVGIDAATDVVNEASFRYFFRVILAQTRRMESNGALMFVHVESLPDVRATHGGVAAQKMLVEVSNAVKRSVRESDMVALAAEDAFCVVLHNTLAERCARVCRQILGLVDNMSLHIGDVELRPRVSISTLNFPVDDLSAEEILSLPDRVPFTP